MTLTPPIRTWARHVGHATTCRVRRAVAARHGVVARRASVTVVALVLAGCGGGVWVGFGPDDDSPSVALAASPNAARPGDTLTLVAAASDDHHVVEVAFFRIEPNGTARLLGVDAHAPFTWTTPLPAVASGSTVQFIARAVDDANQATDSAPVDVIVLP